MQGRFVSSEGNDMSGYTIDPAAAAQAIEQLNEILEELKSEIQNLTTVEEDILSDANWQGPKKQEYRTDFNVYLDAATKLMANGYEHLEALQGMVTAYIENER